MYLESGVSPMGVHIWSHQRFRSIGNFDSLEGPEGQSDGWSDGYISELTCLGNTTTCCKGQQYIVAMSRDSGLD